MKLSIPDAVVEWSTLAIRASGQLPGGLQIVPYISDKDANANRLVIKCELGEQILEADQPFNATLTFELRALLQSYDETKVKDLWAKIEAALIAGLLTPGTDINARGVATFSTLRFFVENATTSLDRGTSVRKFTRTIPLHVATL
jgi:spore coat protein CotH